MLVGQIQRPGGRSLPTTLREAWALSVVRGLWCVLSALCVVAILGGCGGSVGGPEGAGGALIPIPSLTGGSAGSGGEATGGAPGTGGTTIATGGSEPDYEEPDCPDIEPPPPTQECDPLEPAATGCGVGEGCYPYLQYPGGERCGLPQFGSVCAPASTGSQGDSCGDQQGYCEPGFLCVVGTGGGPRCARLCLTAEPTCPAGLVCTETDVQGYGVCF